mgnify:CR=1 FL=1
MLILILKKSSGNFATAFYYQTIFFLEIIKIHPTNINPKLTIVAWFELPVWGNSGTSGPSRTSGISGSLGTTGVSGFSETSGVSGTSNVSESTKFSVFKSDTSAPSVCTAGSLLGK